MSVYFVTAAVALMLAGAADASLQSPSLARELVAMLGAQNLEAVAAADPSEPDRFVAALFFQHEQLLLVNGRSPSAAAVRQRIDAKQYADVYRDLSVTAVPESRVMLYDLKADGLQAKPASAVDVLYEGPANQTIFDGNWKEHKLSESAYEQKVMDTDATYSRLLTLLIEKLKAQS